MVNMKIVKGFGEKFPTKFECQGGEVAIPINYHGKVIIKTNVANDYFNRLKDTGYFDHDNKNIKISNVDLRNGQLTIKVKPWHDAQIGDKQKCVFSFSDCQNVEPLSCEIEMIISKEREIDNNNDDNDNTKIKMPDIHFENKKEAHDFDDESGAIVVVGQENTTIYVNRNNKYLENIIFREAEDKKEYYLNTFKNAVGLQTLALYDKFKDSENVDDIVAKSSSAIAMSMIAVIQATGKEICNY